MLEYKESLGGTQIFIYGNWVGWKLRGINKKNTFNFLTKTAK